MFLQYSVSAVHLVNVKIQSSLDSAADLTLPRSAVNCSMQEDRAPLSLAGQEGQAGQLGNVMSGHGTVTT